MKEHSLNELRRISAKQNETHQQLSAIIDQRKAELRAATEQLYVQIESFRVEQQHEIRNEIGVAVDFAIKALPWWKRMVRKNVLSEAAGYMVDLREMRIAEATRVKAEIDAEAKKIEEDRNREATLKAQAEFAAKADVNKDGAMNSDKPPVATSGYVELAQEIVGHHPKVAGVREMPEVRDVAGREVPVDAVAMEAGPFDQNGNVVNPLDQDPSVPPMREDGTIETLGTVSKAEFLDGAGNVLASKEFDTAK